MGRSNAKARADHHAKEAASNCRSKLHHTTAPICSGCCSQAVENGMDEYREFAQSLEASITKAEKEMAELKARAVSALGTDNAVTEWIVALAYGFKKAGCRNAPIVPDPEVIAACIMNREKITSLPRACPVHLAGVGCLKLEGHEGKHGNGSFVEW